MTIFAIVISLLMIAVFFALLIWLLVLGNRFYAKWILHQNVPQRKTGRTAQKSAHTSERAINNNDHLASKMMRQQIKHNQHQRYRSLAPNDESRGIQHVPGGPLFNTKHYRQSHFTDQIVNEPQTFRRNNKTYGKGIETKLRDKQNQRDQQRYQQSQQRHQERSQRNAGKQRGHQQKQAKKQIPTNKKMLDSLADAYAQSMEYSTGYQQAVKRSQQKK